MKSTLKTVKIDIYSLTPKYLQVTNCILQGIQSGLIKKDEILPSINEFSCSLETARSTIERAYNELKRMELVTSVAGKGFFIANTFASKPRKILLLFNKLSVHKKIIYDAFAATMGSDANIDFYIYNNDYYHFKRLVQEKVPHYAKCVIIPYFAEHKALGYHLINTLPKEKLILLDKLAEGVEGDFGAVYEDFEDDIYAALVKLKKTLSKYHTLLFIFPQHTHYSKLIISGFLQFCKKHKFNHDVLDSLHQEQIRPGCVYINLVEDDLVDLIEKVNESNLKVGKEVGIISYNETPIKKVILDGITTLSTDFKMMGEKAAELVMRNSRERIAIPFKVTLRNSL
jgi:DNA-binding transcriptional regulator YhcF (GntR family)